MAHRRKNLLDAFQASEVLGKTSEPQPAPPPAAAAPAQPAPTQPAPAPPPRPREPAPHVAAAPAAPVRAPADPLEARRASAEAMRASPDVVRRFGVLAVAVALVVALAFWVGRTSGEASAGDPPRENAMMDRRSAAVPPAKAAPAPEPEPAVEGTNDDQRFRDPANKYTARVVEYRNDTRGRELAVACYEYLRKEGLPAIWPIEQGSALILYVGASASAEEIESIASYISKMRGPTGRQGDFAGAYRVNISDVFAR